VHLSLESAGVIEREADEFASNLLMPGDVLRDRITSQDVDLYLLSGLAKTFGVSFEALCVELQRKVSHYLQPILSHRFLNNLA
jgi:Zn-dependent peptidase ImmA (M78 family)